MRIDVVSLVELRFYIWESHSVGWNCVNLPQAASERACRRRRDGRRDFKCEKICACRRPDRVRIRSAAALQRTSFRSPDGGGGAAAAESVDGCLSGTGHRRAATVAMIGHALVKTAPPLMLTSLSHKLILIIEQTRRRCSHVCFVNRHCESLQIVKSLPAGTNNQTTA